MAFQGEYSFQRPSGAGDSSKSPEDGEDGNDLRGALIALSKARHIAADEGKRLLKAKEELEEKLKESDDRTRRAREAASGIESAFSDLETRLSDTQGRILKISTELDGAKQVLSNFSGDAQALSGEAKSVFESIDRERKSLSSMTGAVSEISGKLALFKDEFARVSRELPDARKILTELEKTGAEASSKKDALSNLLKDSERESERISAEYARLEHVLSDFREKAKESAREGEALRKLVEDTGAEKRAKEAYLIISKANQAAVEEAGRLESLVASIERELSRAGDASRKAVSARDEIVGIVSQFEEEITLQKSKVEQVGALAESLADSLKTVVTYLEKLHSEVDSSKADYAKKREDVELLQKAVYDLNEKMGVLDSSVKSAEGIFAERLSEFERESREFSKILPEAEKIVANSRRMSEEIEGEKRRALLATEDARQELLKIANSFRDDQKPVFDLAERLFKEFSDAKRRVESIDSEYSSLKAILEKLAPEVSARMRELDDLKKQVDSGREALSNSSALAKSAVEDASSKERSLNSEREKILSEISKMTSVLDSKLAELDRKRTQLASIEEAFSRIGEFEKGVKESSGKLALAEEKLAELRKIDSALTVKAAETVALVNSLGDKIASAEDKAAKARGAASEIEAQVSLAKQSVESSASGVFSLRNSVDSFSEKLASITRAKEESERDFSTLAREISEKKAGYERISQEISKAFDEDLRKKSEKIIDYDRKISAVLDLSERALRKGSEVSGNSERMVSTLSELAEKMKIEIEGASESKEELSKLSLAVSAKLDETSKSLERLSSKEPELRAKANSFSTLESAISERLSSAKKRELEAQEIERKIIGISERSESALRKISESSQALESGRLRIAEELGETKKAIELSEEKRKELDELSDKIAEFSEREEEFGRLEQALSERIHSSEEKLSKLSEIEALLEKKAVEIDAIKRVFEEKLTFSAPPIPRRSAVSEEDSNEAPHESLERNSGNILDQVKTLDSLKTERKELSELLNLLSSQREEGLVSDKHFEEIASQTRARLREIERAISEILSIESHIEKHEEDLGKIKSLLKKHKAYYR